MKNLAGVVTKPETSMFRSPVGQPLLVKYFLSPSSLTALDAGGGGGPPYIFDNDAQCHLQVGIS